MSETLSSVTSKISSALQPEEPLVAETVPGSSDAPGAFPESGSNVNNENDVKDAPLVQKQTEDKPISAPTEERKISETTTQKEDEGFSQTFAG